MKRDATADTVGKKPEPLQEWQRDAIAAEPKGFMQDIIAFRRSQSTSMLPDRPRSSEPPAPRGSGWQDAVPLKGVDTRWVDAQLDAQDRIDRANAIRERIQRIESEWIEAKLERRNPYQAKISYEPFSNEAIWGDEDDGKR
jgi:hypothetical protein